ncbi:MAG: sulfatase/phosphatase domain-containing protein [Spirochaetia bacterium]
MSIQASASRLEKNTTGFRIVRRTRIEPRTYRAYGRKDIDKIRELAATDRPFSMVASFWGPHHAYFPTEPYASMVSPGDIPEYPSFADDYAGKPARHYLQRDMHHSGVRRWRDWSIWQEVLARCYGQIIQTDAAIGRILDSLDDLGITDNTIVIMCADHGDAVASHGGLWDKASTYIEEVARVPLFVRWPDRFTGGTVVDRPVGNLDVTATMVDAAGLEVPEWMQSRSLLPVCTDPETLDYPDHIVAEHNGHGEVILQRIIVEGSLKYVAALFDGDELYDLDDDPFERRNLLNDPEYADAKARLRRKLIRHIESTGDKRAAKLRHTLELGL